MLWPIFYSVNKGQRGGLCIEKYTEIFLKRRHSDLFDIFYKKVKYYLCTLHLNFGECLDISIVIISYLLRPGGINPDRCKI